MDEILRKVDALIERYGMTNDGVAEFQHLGNGTWLVDGQGTITLQMLLSVLRHRGAVTSEIQTLLNNEPNHF